FPPVWELSQERMGKGSLAGGQLDGAGWRTRTPAPFGGKLATCGPAVTWDQKPQSNGMPRPRLSAACNRDGTRLVWFSPRLCFFGNKSRAARILIRCRRVPCLGAEIGTT